MAGREERAGQIGTHVLRRVTDYSAGDIRLDPAEEAVLGLGRCLKAHELPETAVKAAEALGLSSASRRVSPKKLPPLSADLRASPVETQARPTWLDAVQLHGIATPAINGALTAAPGVPAAPAAVPRPASRSMSPDAAGAPFSAFSPSGGDVSAISCRYLGGFGETNGFDSPTKAINQRRQSGGPGVDESSGMVSEITMRAMQRRIAAGGDPKQPVHGYRRPKTYHERLAENRRRYMTEEYARIRAAKEAREAEEQRAKLERQEEEERAKQEYAERRERALRRRAEEAALEQGEAAALQAVREADAAVSLQAGARGFVARREHKQKLNSPVTLLSVHGGPGSGKTTLCEYLVGLADMMGQDSGIRFKHLSSGRLLRRAVESKSHPEWLAIMACMDDGTPVPDQIVIEVVMAEVTRFRFQSHNMIDQPVCVLDNFPGNTTQQQLLQQQVGQLSAMFNLEVDEETMLQRVLKRAKEGRRTSSNFQQQQQQQQQPPDPSAEPSPAAPAALLQHPRRDDTEETAHATIARYRDHIAPMLLADFEREGTMVKVRAINAGAERTLEDTCNDVAEQVAQVLLLPPPPPRVPLPPVPPRHVRCRRFLLPAWPWPPWLSLPHSVHSRNQIHTLLAAALSAPLVTIRAVHSTASPQSQQVDTAWHETLSTFSTMTTTTTLLDPRHQQHYQQHGQQHGRGRGVGVHGRQ